MQSVRGRLAAALIVPALVLTATGCSKNESSDSPGKDTGDTAAGAGLGGVPGADMPNDDVCTTDKVGGEMTVAAYSDPPGLDPVAAQANLGNLQLPQIYGTLMRFNYSTSTYEPWLAESLTGNADSTEWTLKLKPDAEFGDGTPMTADAVKSSIERFTVPENAGTWTSLVSLIKSMDVQDPTTLVFQLTSPWGSFPYLLTQDPGMVVNPAVVSADAKALATAVPEEAAAGPYTVDSYEAGQSMVLKAKSDWWGGPVCISTLTFQPIVAGATAYDSYRADQLQGLVTFDSPVIKQAADAKEPLMLEGSPTVSTLQLNAKELPDANVRQAIAYALDLPLVNQRVYAGVGSTSTAFLAPGSDLSKGMTGIGYDLQKAKSLLATAKKNGYDGKLEFLVTQSPLQDNLSILETAMLEKAGFEVKRTLLQNTDLITRVYVNKDYQMALWGTTGDPACAWCDAQPFLSTSSSNIGFFKDPTFDTKMTDLQAATTPDEVRAAATAVQTAMNESVPAVYNGYLPYVFVHTDKLHGVRQSANQILLFDTAYLSN